MPTLRETKWLSGRLDTYDPFTFPNSLTGLLHGEKWHTYFFLQVDPPDPYVKLYIRTAPNGKKRTKAIKNNPNPVWEEEFQFHLDPNFKNILGKFSSICCF